MATLVRNRLADAILSLPAQYGGAELPPGGAVIIADTLANVQAAFGTPLPSSDFIEMTTVPDGQASAITPSADGAAGGTSYTPGAASSWTAQPANVGAALDAVGAVAVKKLTTTITLAQLQALAGGVKTQAFNVGAALPAGARICGFDIGEGTFTGFDDGGGGGTCTCSLGGAGATDITTATNIATGQTGFPKTGTAGALGFLMAPQGSQQLKATVTSNHDLNLATAFNLVVNIFYIVLA